MNRTESVRSIEHSCVCQQFQSVFELLCFWVEHSKGQWQNGAIANVWTSFQRAAWSTNHVNIYAIALKYPQIGFDFVQFLFVNWRHLWLELSAGLNHELGECIHPALSIDVVLGV